MRTTSLRAKDSDLVISNVRPALCKHESVRISSQPSKAVSRVKEWKAITGWAPQVLQYISNNGNNGSDDASKLASSVYKLVMALLRNSPYVVIGNGYRAKTKRIYYM